MQFLKKENLEKKECFLYIKSPVIKNKVPLEHSFNIIGIDLVELYDISFINNIESHDFIKDYIFSEQTNFKHIKINKDIYKIKIHKNEDNTLYTSIQFNPNYVLYRHNANNSNNKDIEKAINFIEKDFKDLFNTQLDFSKSKIRKIELNVDFNYKLGLYPGFAESLFITENTRREVIIKNKNSPKDTDNFDLKPIFKNIKKQEIKQNIDIKRTVRIIKYSEFLKTIIDEKIKRTKKYKEELKKETPENLKIESLESIFFQGQGYCIKLYDKRKELKNKKINTNIEKTRLELTITRKNLSYYQKQYSIDNSLNNLLENFDVYQEIYRKIIIKNLLKKACFKIEELKNILKREYLNYKKNSHLQRKTGNKPKSVWLYLLELDYFDKEFLIEISKEFDNSHTTRNKKYIENFNKYKSLNNYENDSCYWWDIPNDYKNLNNNKPLEELKNICNFNI